MYNPQFSVLGIEPRASWESTVQGATSSTHNLFFYSKFSPISHLKRENPLISLDSQIVYCLQSFVIDFVQLCSHVVPLVMYHLNTARTVVVLFLGDYSILLERTVNSLLAGSYSHH